MYSKLQPHGIEYKIYFGCKRRVFKTGNKKMLKIHYKSYLLILNIVRVNNEEWVRFFPSFGCVG